MLFPGTRHFTCLILVTFCSSLYNMPFQKRNLCGVDIELVISAILLVGCLLVRYECALTSSSSCEVKSPSVINFVAFTYVFNDFSDGALSI